MDLTLNWRDEAWVLLGERALWRERTRTLILSDIHLGKAHDFQAAGVPVPIGVHEEDFARLEATMNKRRPLAVHVLGDLVHSHRQPYPDLATKFAELRAKFKTTKWVLALGNHDVRARKHLGEWGFDEICDRIEDGELTFAHDDLGVSAGVSGHVHPVVRLQVGADRMRLPCFVVGPERLLLPAFGTFTGGYDVTPTRLDRIYVVAGREVVAVPNRQFD